MGPDGDEHLAYLAISGEWKILLRVDVGTGLLVVFMTGHPWVVAMNEPPRLVDRFIMRTSIACQRAFTHSMTAVLVLLPVDWLRTLSLDRPPTRRGLAGIGRLRGRVNAYTPQQKFILMMLLWAILGFLSILKSSTKFPLYSSGNPSTMHSHRAFHIRRLGKAEEPGLC